MQQYEETDPEFVKQFLRDLYIDDSSTGVNSNEDGFRFYKKAKSAMKDAGFELRKWASNSKDLLKRICVCEGIEYREDDALKGVLGLHWDTSSDEFIIMFTKVLTETVKLKPTKRNILRIAASFYNPLGWINSIVIQARILLQQICRTDAGWDDLVTDEIVTAWNEFVNKLEVLHCVKVDR